MNQKIKNSLISFSIFLSLWLWIIAPIALFLIWKYSGWSHKSKIIGTISTIFLASMPLILIFIYAFFYRPFQVSGISMLPNHPQGQYLMAKIYRRDRFKLNRGDVVIFRAPPAMNCLDKLGCNYIHRIIGLPGETVEIRDGKVLLNGQVLDESAYLFVDVVTEIGAFMRNQGQVVIPVDQYFVMGDNRPLSSDSRQWGLVPEDLIIGRVAFCYANCK